MNAAINTLSAFATFANKVSQTSYTKKVDPKVQFAKFAAEARQALIDCAEHKWFNINADKTVSVQLKRGIKPLVLNGQNLMICPNVTAAICLLDQAAKLASAGLLDAELEAAAPSPRKKKVKTEVAAA